VNSAFLEVAPSVSKNGLSLYFQSNRPGTLGGFDLYVSQRTSPQESWGPPVNLGPVLNSTGGDVNPALSRDEHYLFFATDRPGGLGGLDIWVSRREHTHDDFAWETPTPITEINSSVSDGGPVFFENERGRPQLYFGSTRTGGAGDADLYLTEQQEDGTWSPPTPVAELNSAFQEQNPSIRYDGLEIFFASTRPSSVGFDLWTSTRENVTAMWSTPVRIDINSPQNDNHPGLSGDGMTLYFTSNRLGGVGNDDLWVSTRERRRGNE
jgi:Tol biopolymer transport system component